MDNNKKENLADESLDEISENNVRDELARKFKEGYREPKIGNADEIADDEMEDDEDVKDFLQQKNGKSDLTKKEEFFQPVQPSNTRSYMWTIILIILILISLTVVVVLVIRNGTVDKNKVSDYEKVNVFNNQKAKFDQSFVNATNKLIEAENSFNAKDYVKANESAKAAGDLFDESLDELSDLQILKMGERYKFLDDYYSNLEEAGSLGVSMSSNLAYAARSADRDEATDAAKSLTKYQADANDYDTLLVSIAKIKKDNSEYFGE